MTNQSITILQTTYPNQEVAEKMTSIFLNKKLIACAHLSLVESFYIWDGSLQQSEETLCVFKTIPELVNKLKKEIIQTHTYQLPEILFWSVSASLDYTQWVHSCCLHERQE